MFSSSLVVVLSVVVVDVVVCLPTPQLTEQEVKNITFLKNNTFSFLTKKSFFYGSQNFIEM